MGVRPPILRAGEVARHVGTGRWIVDSDVSVWRVPETEWNESREGEEEGGRTEKGDMGRMDRGIRTRMCRCCARERPFVAHDGGHWGQRSE